MVSYKKHNLSEAALEKVAQLFKVLSEPMRLRLLYSLRDREEKSVSQLMEETGGVQANVSKHLGILLDSGVVKRRKKGLYAYYRITDESIFELCDVACGSIYERLSADLDRLSGKSS